MIKTVFICDACSSEITGGSINLSVAKINQSSYNIQLSVDYKDIHSHDKHFCGMPCLTKFFVTKLLKENKDV